MVRKSKDLSSESAELLFKLQKLKKELDEETVESYQRVNPFFENLTNWKEKGEKYAGKDSTIYDSATLIGEVEIGSECWIGPFTLIDGSGKVSIGDHTVISSGTHIYTHDTVKWALSRGIDSYVYAPVVVGSCVFVGAQSVIVRGVSIGDHSLVSANATVVNDVPSYSIVAGTPAKIIGRVCLNHDGVKLEYFKTNLSTRQ